MVGIYSDRHPLTMHVMHTWLERVTFAYGGRCPKFNWQWCAAPSPLEPARSLALPSERRPWHLTARAVRQRSARPFDDNDGATAQVSVGPRGMRMHMAECRSSAPLLALSASRIA